MTDAMYRVEVLRFESRIEQTNPEPDRAKKCNLVSSVERNHYGAVGKHEVYTQWWL